MYASSPGKAKNLSFSGPWEWDWWDFVHLRVRRMPEFDHDNPPHKIVEMNCDLAEGLPPFYNEDDSDPFGDFFKDTEWA